MDVLARLSSLDDADLFGTCMALDLPGGMDCSDLPSPALPEGARQRDKALHLEACTQPAQLQIPDPYTMDLQDCLASPAFEATLFGLTDHLNDQFSEQFMDTQFAFDMPAEQNGGETAETDNAGTDLSSRVSKESSAEIFHDTPRTLHHVDAVAATAHSLGANSFTTLGASQWPCSYPANFIPAQGFGSSIPVSCPSSSSSYAQPPSSFPYPEPSGPMLLKHGAHLLQGVGSAPGDQTLASMLDALDSPTSISAFSSMPDQQHMPWGPYDGQEHDGLHRQSESGSSGQPPSRGWQPVPQRKAVKRSFGRSKSSGAASDMLGDLPVGGAAAQQQPHPPPDPFAFTMPKLPPILARPADYGNDDTSREGTPTPTGQTEWLRIQMMKLMSTTPGCAAVPLRNLRNSPRAHSQPNSPCSARSPRGGARSRPGTPKARTPRGTTPKTVFQQSSTANPNPSRLGAMPHSPTQRSKVARSANPDVSVQGGIQHQQYNFAQHFGSSLAAAAGSGAVAEQAARLLQQAGAVGNGQVASAAAVAAAAAAAAMAATSQGPPAGLLTSPGSRPQSGESDRSASSTAEAPSLEDVLDQLAGNHSALEAGGRLLHLQRSFSAGLAPDAVEHVLVALKQSKKVEVVYFPNIPMVLSERQVQLLLTTLQQRHIWALSLGEGTSLTAAGWELLATRLQTTALAYLYVSPATQASIPPSARICIRDGLHANRRAAPQRDPVLLAQMQVMSSTPQPPQPQVQQLPKHQPSVQQLATAAEPGKVFVQGPAPAAATPAAPGQQAPALCSPVKASGTSATHVPEAPMPHGAAPKAFDSTASGQGAAGALPAGADAQLAQRSSLQEPVSGPPMQQEDSQTNSSGTSHSGAETSTGPTSSTTSREASPPAPLDFADLVAVGSVQPGQYQLHIATKVVDVSVLATGSIQWEGMEFSTLATFVKAVAHKQQLPCAQLDPWKEVLLHGISLEALRQAFIERQQ